VKGDEEGSYGLRESRLEGDGQDRVKILQVIMPGTTVKEGGTIRTTFAVERT